MSSFFSRWILDLPINRKLSLMIGLMGTLLTASLVGLWFGMNTLSSLRAFVAGEGFWSKAQKDAVYQLHDYVLWPDNARYRRFVQALDVQHGDRSARLTLSSAHPDYRLAAQGFLAGRNHPDDIAGMISLFTRYRRLPHIREAVVVWQAADEEVARLETWAQTLHQRLNRSTLSAHERESVFRHIDAVNATLTTLEDAFSVSLGEASRWTKNALFLTITLLTGALGACSLLLAMVIGRAISSGIHTIQDAAQRVAAGDLKTRVEWPAKDEVGRLATAFNQMTENLGRAEQIKSDFLSNVSHELRTPLTLTLAPTESILGGDYGPLSETQRHAMETVHNNAVRLLQMVNGLLDFSKLEASQMAVTREPSDLSAEIQLVLQDFKPLMERKGVTVEAEVPPTALAMIDRYLFERILFNLLSNASKFTPPGGRITIALQVTGGRFELSVTDTGIGIAEDQMPNLFQRFRQLDGSATRRFEGTGLGLALVKEFAGLLGGTVQVSSQKGQGSTFIVEGEAPETKEPVSPRARAAALIPRYHTDAAIPTVQASLQESDRLDVLIAEDNPDMAHYLAGLIRGLCRPTLASNGEEALMLLHTKPFALVLSDVMMPKKDGLTLCREIKAEPRLAKTRVLLLTALTHREALLQGWEAGADEYLFKPFHPQEVVTRVRSMLAMVRDQAHAESELEAIQAQLRQAGKLEAIGRLAGGVAHDFNNVLTGIVGFTEELHEGLHGDQDKQWLTSEILKTCQRAYAITRQLLMFARRETAQIKVFDLNALVADTVPLLKRLLGEDVAIDLDLQHETLVEMDPSQLEQVLLNLAANARDAMPGGGQLRIASSMVHLEERVSDQRQHTLGTGDYALLEISDTGSGIRDEVLPHLFEPFFTTKGKSAGTGLGLSTVYGIVKQNKGDIRVVSEVGKGTTFKVYFQKARGPMAAALPIDAPPERGHATVLVVEDDPLVRRIAVRKLQQNGFAVLEAENGIEALKHQDKPIDLLLTDVIMPGINGNELAKRLGAANPSLKILFMSGYPEDIIVQRGIIPSQMAYIEKTHLPSRLVAKVHETLKSWPNAKAA